jgi:hypothetical protein
MQHESDVFESVCEAGVLVHGCDQDPAAAAAALVTYVCVCVTLLNS